MMREHPGGLIAELVTPADENSLLDGEGYGRLLERAAGTASAVLVAGIAAGESLWLPQEVRRRAVSLALEVLRGKIPLIACVTSVNPREVRANIQSVEEEIKRQKYSGEVFLADAPLCYRGNRGLADYYREIFGACGLPFILVNDPGAAAGCRGHFRRRNIRTNVLKKISGNPGVAGLAHNGSLNRSLNYMKAVRERPDFGFYDANELNFLNSPVSGGVVSSGVNLFPRAWRQVVEASSGADEKEKRDESYRMGLLEKREALKAVHRASRGDPAGLIKAALCSAGIIAADRVFRPGPVSTRERKEKIISLASVKFG